MARAPFIVRSEEGRQRALQVIASLDLAKPWEIIVAPHRKKRTLSQLGLYWKWINEVAEMVARETGHDADEIHEFFKQKFLPPEVIEINGEIIERRTTTNKSTVEMTAYMDRIYAFCTSELGLFLTLPEHMHERDFA